MFSLWKYLPAFLLSAKWQVSYLSKAKESMHTVISLLRLGDAGLHPAAWIQPVEAYALEVSMGWPTKKGVRGVGAAHPKCLWKFKKVRQTVGALAYTGRFNRISACNSLMYLIIHSIVNCFLSTVHTLGTVE